MSYAPYARMLRRTFGRRLRACDQVANVTVMFVYDKFASTSVDDGAPHRDGNTP